MGPECKEQKVNDLFFYLISGLRPGGDAAFEVLDDQAGDFLRPHIASRAAASAKVALHDEFFALKERKRIGGDFCQRHQCRSFDVALGIFAGFANIDEDGFAGLKPLLYFGGGCGLDHGNSPVILYWQ
jgi:hypothetical protein